MDAFGFTRLQSDNNISSSTKTFMNDLSNVIDSRIAEINDQLQKSKRQLLEKYKEMVDETDRNSTRMKDFFYAMQDTDDGSADSQSIESLRKFRDHLDEYLKDSGRFVDIHKKFSEEKLPKLIVNRKGNYQFIEYKIKSKGGDECNWNQTQPKNHHTLSEEKKVMDVNYTGCYELYSTETEFKEGKHYVTLEILCEKTTTYHSFGLVNEHYNSSSNCVCCKNDCFFMVNRSGDTFNAGITGHVGGISLNDGNEPYKFDIEIDLEDPDNKKWSFKHNDQEFGPWEIKKGNVFKIAAGMCNGGKVKYTLV